MVKNRKFHKNERVEKYRPSCAERNRPKTGNNVGTHRIKNKKSKKTPRSRKRGDEQINHPFLRKRRGLKDRVPKVTNEQSK